jgi:uncharacterized protein
MLPLAPLVFALSTTIRHRGVPFGCGLILLVIAWTVSGCQIIPEARPDPTRYYVLVSPEALRTADVAPDGVTLGLRPVELPGYLRTSRSLVVAQGPNELIFRDFDRWAEPLEAGLGRVFRDSLNQASGINRVATFPFGTDRQRDLDLTIRIIHCEGYEARGRRVVRFVASYELTRTNATGEVIHQGVYTAPEAPWDGEASSLAAQIAEAAATAARAIAAEIPRPDR